MRLGPLHWPAAPAKGKPFKHFKDNLSTGSQLEPSTERSAHSHEKRTSQLLSRVTELQQANRQDFACFDK